MAAPGRWVRARTSAVAGAVAVGLLIALAAPLTEGAYAPLAPGIYSSFLNNLAVPVADPGTTVTLTGTLSDPASFGPLVAVNLTLALYGYNGFPGNDTGPLPSGGVPSFVDAASDATVVTIAAPSLAPGANLALSEPIVVPSGAPAGAYAVRSQLSFVENGSPFLLESRGYFSYAAWTNATAGPNGTTTLNLTRLGVSGVLPETAVPVVSDPYPWVLAGLAGAAVVCAAVGGFYASRRGPGSSAGAKAGAGASSAPSARGNRRTSDGD